MIYFSQVALAENKHGIRDIFRRELFVFLLETNSGIRFFCA